MIKRRHVLFIFVFVILSIASVPHTSQAKILNAYYNTDLTPTPSDIYLLFYDKDAKEKEIIITREIYARQCMQTPTAFRTVEMDDALVTKVQFDYGAQTFLVMHPEGVYTDEYVYMVTGANDTKTQEISFFVTYSNDSGVTWSDMHFIYNTTLTSANLYQYVPVIIEDNLYIYYTYKSSVFPFTNVTIVDLSTLEVLDVLQLQDFFGKDFDLYYHNNKLYIVSTDPTDKDYVRFTYSEDGYNISDIESRIPSLDRNVTLHNPTLTYWKDGFYIVAEDMHDAIIHQKEVSELYLWGVWIEDVGKTVSPSDISKLGSQEYDGYFEKDASITVVNNQLFVSCTQDKSAAGLQGYPDIAFFFSADGKTWTHQFMGSKSLISNPGVIFAIATVIVFAVTVPVVLVIQKRMKE